MSFRPAARMFFERRASAPPALPYDAEVKWLESTGTQYIDTGVYARDGLIVEAGLYYSSLVEDSSLRCFFGAGSLFSRIGMFYNNQYVYVGLNTTASTIQNAVPADYKNRIVNIRIDTTGGAKYATIDGDKVLTNTSQSSNVSAKCVLLFNSYMGNALQYGAQCRISSFSIKDATTDNLLVDLIPVRFTNELHESEGAMYDRVSKTLFRNQGTGKFIVGADAGMPYDCEVAYVQKEVGTQYPKADEITCDADFISAYCAKKYDVADLDVVVFCSAYRTVADTNSLVLLFGETARGKGSIRSSASAQNAAELQFNNLSAYLLPATCTALDDYKRMRYVIRDFKLAAFVDGVKVGEYAYNGTASAVGTPYLMMTQTNSGSHTARVLGIRVVKDGTDVIAEAIPVSVNGGVAMYNSVGGHLWEPADTQIAGSSAYSLGPVVSNEGPRPYAYKAQYIETDGVASYIDTGIPADGSDVKLVFNFAFVGEASSNENTGNLLFGIQSGWNVMRCDKTYITPGNYTFDTDGNTFYECEMQYFAGDRYSKVNGTTINTNTGTGVAAVDANYPIGGYYAKVNESADTNLTRVGRVKCAKFLAFDKDGNCILNLIPVVDRNGVACMYDYVTKTLKYNAASSGTITAGPISA